MKKEGSPSPITVALLPSSQLAFGREDSSVRLSHFFRGKIKATFFGFAWIWVSHPTQYKNFPWVSHDSPLYWMLPCYSSTYERNETNLIFLSCNAERFLDEISHAKKLDNNEDDEQIFTLLKVLWEFSSFSDGSLEQPPFMKIIVRSQTQVDEIMIEFEETWLWNYNRKLLTMKVPWFGLYVNLGSYLLSSLRFFNWFYSVLYVCTYLSFYLLVKRPRWIGHIAIASGP